MQVPATTLPDSVIAHKALVYKQTKTSAQTLDIYQQTQQTQTAPLIMLIHGGGWQSGTPALMTALAIALVERGYVVATPSYRLSDEAPYPAAVEDLVSAFHWLNNNAAQYNIDSTKIALSGGSAGGQLAALLAYSGGIVDSSDTNSKRFNVQALINIDGLSDFTSPEALPFENNSAKSVTSASKWLGVGMKLSHSVGTTHRLFSILIKKRLQHFSLIAQCHAFVQVETAQYKSCNSCIYPVKFTSLMMRRIHFGYSSRG
jgi:pectinesterase